MMIIYGGFARIRIESKTVQDLIRHFACTKTNSIKIIAFVRTDLNLMLSYNFVLDVLSTMDLPSVLENGMKFKRSE